MLGPILIAFVGRFWGMNSASVSGLFCVRFRHLDRKLSQLAHHRSVRFGGDPCWSGRVAAWREGEVRTWTSLGLRLSGLVLETRTGLHDCRPRQKEETCFRLVRIECQKNLAKSETHGSWHAKRARND